jgi:hypothetical protein
VDPFFGADARIEATSFSSGFDLAEALDLLALGAIIEGGDSPPQPIGWSMVFDSAVIGPFTTRCFF